MTDARLEKLAALLGEFGEKTSGRKLDLLDELETAILASSADVLALHEALCFLRAYPDDAHVLAAATRLLEGFSRRKDLRRFHGALENSGIAGTEIVFPFFYPTACWLAARCAGRLTVEWDDFPSNEAFEKLLPFLTTPSEMPVVDEFEYSPRDWIGLLKGPEETDADFLVKSFRGMEAPQPTQELLWDGLGTRLRLDSRRDRPSRTLARYPVERVRYQAQALDRARPSLKDLAALAPRLVRGVSVEEGQDLIDLAQEAMVTRERDLDAFAYGNPADVRIVEFADGVHFAQIGLRPERRLLLESVYGFLTLKNGVPIGYVLSSALFGSSEIAYNVFDTFRGGESARIYGHVVGMLHAVFGSDTFVVFPYQLGWENEEGLESGAWWFYQKLGFRPKDPECLRIMEDELARMRKNPAHRSSRATLEKLAEQPVFLHAGPERDDVIGRVSLGDIGLKVARFLGARFGADRVKGVEQCARTAAHLLGVQPSQFWREGQVEAFERWSPLVLSLPGVERWSAEEKKALAGVMRAKGGRRETDYVRQSNAHPKLRAALLAMAVPD